MIKHLDELDNLLEKLAAQERAMGFNEGIQTASFKLSKLAQEAFGKEKDKEAQLLRDLSKQIALFNTDNPPRGAWEKIQIWIDNNK